MNREAPATTTLRSLRVHGGVRHRPVARTAAKVSALGWRVFAGVVALGCALLGLEAYRVVLGPNWHTVQSGRIYRAAQLTPKELEQAMARFGIRTVINLRGTCPGDDWYREEAAVLNHHGIRLVDINLSSAMPPPVPEFQRLVNAVSTCEYPLLIHCRRGSDRTGVGATVALLAASDQSLERALHQMSVRFGHMPFGKVQVLDEVFADYRAWLDQRQVEHAPGEFKHWALNVYRPGPYWAQIEPLDVPQQLRQGEPAAMRVRLTNRSGKVWKFKQAAHCGIHLRYYLLNANRQAGAVGGAGFFDRELPPGASLDLDVPIPPVRQTGRYDLVVDLSDEQCCWFHMVGSTPYRQSVEVVP